MISFRCLNPMCARAWTETIGFQLRMPKQMRGRCAYCGHRSIAETVKAVKK